jgi:acyl-CoA synthetase (AMP-forming)/AMP-acid ligase II
LRNRIENILAFARQLVRLTRDKQPKQVRFVEVLPRNTAGTVLKRAGARQQQLIEACRLGPEGIQ